ncbi:MAG: formylglycine-generating enzyme family protein [Chloroflexi bacterium]|nr:formylglycine-generating enzyme family protein [Chloroflexota bacterium]
MVRQHNFKNIRALLIEGFTGEELRELCFDAPDFRPVYHQLAQNTGKDEIVRRLLEYAQKMFLIDQLLILVQERNPALYEVYQSYYDRNPRPTKFIEPETVPIPAGPFLMGSLESAEPNELPQHLVDLAAYRIGKYAVTNAQYAEFVKQAKYPAPPKGGWFGKIPPKDKFDHPVVSVSWYDARAYCEWLSQQTGRIYRLPTEAEWEKAARGTDGRLYPWGNEWNAGRCNCANTQTTAVAAYTAGQSPYGCYDMIGNVWEWTSTLWGPKWWESKFPYPYQPDDGREDLTATSTSHRLFRGGCFDEEIAQLRCSTRRWFAPDHQDKRCGFRVVLQLKYNSRSEE